MKKLNTQDRCDNCGSKPPQMLHVTTQDRVYAYCSVTCRSQKWINSETWPRRDVKVFDLHR